MDERERAIVRKLYELTVQLWEHQGEEIRALRTANDALQKSHETIGQLLKLTADLVNPH